MPVASIILEGRGARLRCTRSGKPLRQAVAGVGLGITVRAPPGITQYLAMTIVTSTCRYKPPPKRKGRKLAEITGLAIVSAKRGRRQDTVGAAAAAAVVWRGGWSCSPA